MSFEGVINHQDFLLTINRHREGEVKNALPGVHVTPCFLDPENGTWVVYARFDAGTVLPKHFHTGTVHFYTTAGSWAYVEYPNDVQTAGSYLYEPGGSIHTFASKEGTEGFMVIQGANINFHDDGTFMNIMDAGWIEHMILEAAKRNGQAQPKYIRPSGDAKFTA